MILLSDAWLASFGLKYSFEFFTQRRGQRGKFEYRQKNTKIAAIFESILLKALLFAPENYPVCVNSLYKTI